MSQSDSAAEVARLTKVFNEIDEDKDGTISMAELEKAFSAAFKGSGMPCTDNDVKKHCAAIMKALDKDNDSKITLDEYIQYYTTKNSLF